MRMVKITHACWHTSMAASLGACLQALAAQRDHNAAMLDKLLMAQVRGPGAGGVGACSSAGRLCSPGRSWLRMGFGFARGTQFAHAGPHLSGHVWGLTSAQRSLLLRYSRSTVLSTVLRSLAHQMAQPSCVVCGSSALLRERPRDLS